MRFPLIGAGYTGFSSQGDSVRNVNLFIHKGAKGAKNELCLLGSPGEILRFNVGNSPVRDMHVVGNVLYAVAGNQLYTISLNGTITAVPGPCSIHLSAQLSLRTTLLPPRARVEVRL